MKISELIKILRGEGDVASVRRAERIADEAPYAAERINAETLRSAISRGDNAASLAIIKPEDFRYLASQLPQEYMSRPETQRHIADLQGIAQQKGFDDVPFLEYGEYPGINQLGVFGHEGRHRMRALEGLGDEKALVRLLPQIATREPLPRRSRVDFLTALSEKYGEPLYLDPEGYNELGGYVQTIPMRKRLRRELEEAGKTGTNFDIEEFRKKYGYTGRKSVQPFSGGGLAKFFSAVDEAVANLRQKKGTGEQMLKQIQQSPGVKKEEIELRRLPEKLAGQQKITQEDLQAMIKAVPAPKLKVTQRGGKKKPPVIPDLDEWVKEEPSRQKMADVAKRYNFQLTQNPEYPDMIAVISPEGDIFDFWQVADAIERDIAKKSSELTEINKKLYGMVDRKGDFLPGVTKAQVATAQNEYHFLSDQIKSLRDEYNSFEQFVQEWSRVVNPPQNAADQTKFSGFTTKGPRENYRELLIQLERPERKQIEMPPFEYNRQGLGGDPQEVTVDEALQRLGLRDPDELGYGAESVLFYPGGNYIVKRNDGRYYAYFYGDEIMKQDLGEVETWLATRAEGDLKSPKYEWQGKPYVKATHFPEEDIVVHARVDDRVGPNGEKILYVEEIQSDWHQAARKARLEEAESLVKNNAEAQKEISEAAALKTRKELGVPEDLSTDPRLDPEFNQRFLEVFEELEEARVNEEAKKLPKDFGYTQMGTRTPPWQQTSHELAVKQIFDTAANEGYDKVMFAPGSEQVKRYSLGEYFDELQVSSMKTRDGVVYIVSGTTKDGQNIQRTFASKKELSENIGDDKAKIALERIAQNRASGSRDPVVLTGEDLLLGGKKAQGKLKIYDEIIPGYVSKYAGKEFNVQPGRSSVVVDDVERARQEYRSQRTKDLQTELLNRFEHGDLDPDLDLELTSLLDEKKLQKVRADIFSPSYSSPHLLLGRARSDPFSPSAGGTPYTRFLQRFKPLGDDIENLSEADELAREAEFLSQVDPSSFSRGSGYILNINPERFRFKDPAKQAEYEQFLEEEFMNTALDERTKTKFTLNFLADIAKKRIESMPDEELFKGMPPLKTVEGVAIDITPEMREKIRTRGQPLFAVPPAVGIGAAVQEEEPVQEFKEAGRVEKKKGMQQEQFESPFDETRRIGQAPGLSTGPAKLRDLTRILRGEDTEAKNIERQRIAGNVEAGRGFGEYMYDMLVPQAWWEFPLEAAFFPVPRPVRKGLLAAAAAMYDPEAEAGKMTLLHGSPQKIKDLQAGKDLWMTTDPEYALKRAMDKMRMMPGVQGPGVLNRFQIEDTDLMRLVDKYSPEEIDIARRSFSNLPAGRGMTGEEIYEVASRNQGAAKTKALENVTRALGKKGYQVPAGATDKGEWIRVLDQTDLERFGTGGKVIDALKGALKMTDEAPDPSRRKAIGLREKIAEPGQLTTIETEVSASDIDTLQRALGNVGEAILNEPVSRREVLKRGALSAASNLIPGGGVLQQVAKEVIPVAAKANLPQIGDEEALASIAKYALGTFNDYGLAENIFDKLKGQSVKRAFNLETEDVGPELWELWDKMSFGENYDDIAKMAGLDINTIAQKTNLPVETVRKLVGNDASVLESLINKSAVSRGLRDVREQVPTWEVGEITGYDDLWSNQKELDDAIRKAIKVGDTDDEEEIVSFVLDEMRSKFFGGHRGKAKNAFDEKITRTLIDDELLDSLWGEALENNDVVYEMILDRIGELK